MRLAVSATTLVAITLLAGCAFEESELDRAVKHRKAENATAKAKAEAAKVAEAELLKGKAELKKAEEELKALQEGSNPVLQP